MRTYTRPAHVITMATHRVDAAAEAPRPPVNPARGTQDIKPGGTTEHTLGMGWYLVLQLEQFLRNVSVAAGLEVMFRTGQAMGSLVR